MTEVPAPFKAVVGLVAAALDRLPEPRELPEKAVELPVLAVSAVLQASLRAQQVYAELTARGDEAIATLRGAPAEPPSWASFDEDTDAPRDDAAEVDPLGAEDLLAEDEAPESDAGGALDGDALDGGVLEGETILSAAQASLLDATPASSPVNGSGSASGYLGGALGRGPSAFDLADDDLADDDTADDAPAGS
jgi:hypothetical protein